MMNLESQRKAIAEACGYTPLHLEEDESLPGRYGQSFEGWKTPDGKPTTWLPNYPEDLQAMWEAEEWLRGKLLPNITGYPSLDAWRWYQNYLLAECPDMDIFHATAAQRARAFLKMWKMWEETPASLDSENAGVLAHADKKTN